MKRADLGEQRFVEGQPGPASALRHRGDGERDLVGRAALAGHRQRTLVGEIGVRPVAERVVTRSDHPVEQWGLRRLF